MPAAEQGKVLFVTGTDTGVGKTLVTAALARHLVRKGLSVGVMKPVETGVSDCSQLGPDAALLKWAAESISQTDEDISPYRFPAPLAPAIAASRAQIRINYSDLLAKAQQVITRHDFTLIEGAGGLMVPLAGGLLMADFAKALKSPLLVICRPNLGTINHTLLTLFCAHNMDLQVAGYLINNMPQSKTPAEETVSHSLASMTGDELLGVLDSVAGTDREKVELLEQQLAKMPTYSLLARHFPLN